MTNSLYFGDNLHVLRKYIADESVDLIYLDPPFNSKADYNVLFAAKSGRGHRAQIEAFEDTWHWGDEAEEALADIKAQGGASASIVRALREALGPSDMMAYIVMMAVRLIEMHRVLKPKGLLYLHCDPTASHYLKIILDSIFTNRGYINEIIWRRSNSHNFKTRYWPRQHDTIFFYAKSTKIRLLPQYMPYGPEQLKRYKPDENGRLYTGQDLQVSLVRQHRQFEWRGVTPPPHRSWGASFEQLEEWYQQGDILLKQDGSPRLDGLKVYLDEAPGKQVGTVWTDLGRVKNTSKERLGYPTQKPLTLMERIILASTKEGDVVLDPFCGCGTTVHAAELHNRQWIGIDITHLAIHVIADRLSHWVPSAKYKIYGQPRDLAGAAELAEIDRYQFQFWATWLCGGRPYGGGKKGPDGGIDGTLEFALGRGRQDWGVVSVKSGKNLGVEAVRSLDSVLRRDNASLGVLVTLHEPTRDVDREAVTAGFAEIDGVRYRRLQIRTIEQLMAGQAIDCPYLLTTTQEAPARSKRGAGSRVSLSPADALAQRNMLLPIQGGKSAVSTQGSLDLGDPSSVQKLKRA